jgi:peptide/nickel transport system permease protein
VTEVLGARLPVTLSLSLGALLLVIVLGVSVGMMAAVRGGFIGRIVEVVAVLVRGLPSFWIAMVAALVFGVQLMWFPVSGYVLFSDSPADWARSLVLPVTVLGLGEAALVAIVARAELLAAMRSDYVRSLRANGYPWKRIVFKHIAKNAAGPVLTMVSLVFVGLLGGTILMEQIFGMPGLGAQMVTSTATHDLPVIQGLAVFYTAMVVVVFLLTDIANGLLNPKVVAR